MPHRLTYDTLPPHSRLRREFSDGSLKIIADAEEPGPLLRRAALVRTAVPAAIICCIALVIFLATFGLLYESRRTTMPPQLSLALLLAFFVFCAALFALIWRAQFTYRMDLAANALKQTTLLVVSEARLAIETTGPDGSSSYDLPKNAVRAIRKGYVGSRAMVDCLEILLTDGSRIHLLAGRDNAELGWIGRALLTTLFSEAKG